MKEISDIIKASDIARKHGKKMALATVVHVEGSSYRRPGARMLVTDDGNLTGAISGGCLEGDALRKALLAITEGKNKLVTYDTTDEDDAKLGIQLGCNGIIHILFEPIKESDPVNPLAILKMLIGKREKAVLSILFNLNKNTEQLGTWALFSSNIKLISEHLPENIKEKVIQDAIEIYEEERTSSSEYLMNNTVLTSLHEFMVPPISLVVMGAGNDAIPLVNMASLLGWRISVFDGRPAYATAARFANADQVVVAKPVQALEHILIDEQTVFVLMSHNYNYDFETLKHLILEDAPYIGVLGPKRKLERMLREVAEQGIEVDEDQISRIFGPVGLDIGAETAEEIALSILAEIKTVFSNRKCMHLREKEGPIHSATAETFLKKNQLLL